MSPPTNLVRLVDLLLRKAKMCDSVMKNMKTFKNNSILRSNNKLGTVNEQEFFIIIDHILICMNIGASKVKSHLTSSVRVTFIRARKNIFV